MNMISLDKFKSFIDSWAKQKDKGEQCLSRFELGQSSPELNAILDNLKQLLDQMTEEYVAITDRLGFVEVDSEHGQETPEELVLLRKCVDMYDQEFMVKECIQSIVSKDGFATKQHLAGSIALWKSESYLDESLVDKIKQL